MIFGMNIYLNRPLEWQTSITLLNFQVTRVFWCFLCAWCCGYPRTVLSLEQGMCWEYVLCVFLLCSETDGFANFAAFTAHSATVPGSVPPILRPPGMHPQSWLSLCNDYPEILTVRFSSHVSAWYWWEIKNHAKNYMKSLASTTPHKFVLLVIIIHGVPTK